MADNILNTSNSQHFCEALLKGHVTVEEMKANWFMLQKAKTALPNLPDDNDSFFISLNEQFFSDTPSRLVDYSS